MTPASAKAAGKAIHALTPHVFTAHCAMMIGPTMKHVITMTTIKFMRTP